MDKPGSRENSTADDLLDRWLESYERGVIIPFEELTEGVASPAVREFAERLPNLLAALGALGELGDDPAFVPLGAPGRFANPLRLGAGGMGVLCVADDLELNRPVAYKVMKPKFRGDGPARDLFLHEARITAALRHPGIVPILGQVEDGTGLPAYAMELVEGETLGDAIRRFRALGPKDVESRREARSKLLRHFVATCRIVAYAHAHHVVHGDIKPLNILIDARFDSTWLIDWGLARRLGPGQDVADDPARDEPTARMGTPFFRGQSFRSGEPATVASDIHCLGVTLAMVLAGPRHESDAGDMAAKLQPASDTPPALWAVANKAKQADRAGRHESAEDLAMQVEAVLDDRPIPEFRDPWTTVARRLVSRHRTLATAAVLSTLLLAVLTSSASMIWSARDRARIKEKEAAFSRKEALQYRATYYVTAAESLMTKLNRSQYSESDSIAMVRSLLAAIELGDQDPEALAETARSVLAQMDENKAADEISRLRNEIRQHKKTIREGITFLEIVSREFPDHRGYRITLAQMHYFLGWSETDWASDIAGLTALLSGAGKLDPRKVADFEATLAHHERAIKALPDFKGDDSRDVISGVHRGKMIILLQLGRFTEALLSFDRALALDEPSRNTAYLRLRKPLRGAAEVEQSHLPWSRPPRVDHARAIFEAEYLAKDPDISAAAVYNAACVFSLASLDPRADAATRRLRADRAISYLRRNAEGGYFHPRAKGIAALLSPKDTLNELLTDADLNPIRDRPDFKAIVAKVAPGAMAGGK